MTVPRRTLCDKRRIIECKRNTFLRSSTSLCSTCLSCCKTRWEESQTHCTSIYVDDNFTIELYRRRLEKYSGTIVALRFRWYGNGDLKEDFVRRALCESPFMLQGSPMMLLLCVFRWIPISQCYMNAPRTDCWKVIVGIETHRKQFQWRHHSVSHKPFQKSNCNLRMNPPHHRNG